MIKRFKDFGDVRSKLEHAYGKDRAGEYASSLEDWYKPRGGISMFSHEWNGYADSGLSENQIIRRFVTKSRAFDDASRKLFFRDVEYAEGDEAGASMIKSLYAMGKGRAKAVMREYKNGLSRREDEKTPISPVEEVAPRKQSWWSKAKEYGKKNWDYLALTAAAGTAVVFGAFAVDSYITNRSLDKEIMKEKAKQERMVDAREVEESLKKLEKSLADLGQKRDEIMDKAASLDDYSQPKVAIAGFVQDSESWEVLPKPKNCAEKEGRLRFSIGEKDIMGKTKDGDYLVELKQDGPQFDRIGVKIGSSDWRYGKPGKAIRARMSGEDYSRHIRGEDVEIQVMGLNDIPLENDTEKRSIVRGSYRAAM